MASSLWLVKLIETKSDSNLITIKMTKENIDDSCRKITSLYSIKTLSK